MRKILYLEPDEHWFLTVRRGTRQILPGAWLVERAGTPDSFEALLDMDHYEMAMLCWPNFDAGSSGLRSVYMKFLQRTLSQNDGSMHVILLPESDELHLDADVAEMISAGRIHVVPKSGYSEQVLLEKIFEISNLCPNTLLIGASDAHYEQVVRLINRRCDNLRCEQRPDLDSFIEASRHHTYNGYILEFELVPAENSGKLVDLILHHLIKPLLMVAYGEDIRLNQSLLGLIGHRQIDFISGQHLDEQALMKLVHCLQCPVENEPATQPLQALH